MKKKKYVKPELMEYSIMPCAPLAASQNTATGSTQSLEDDKEDEVINWASPTESND